MFAVTLVKSTDKAQQYNKTQVVKYTKCLDCKEGKSNRLYKKREKKVYVLANDLSLVCLIAFNLLGKRRSKRASLLRFLLP